MNEYKKSFKKLVEELANLEELTDENVYNWFAMCDKSYQCDGISYKEQQLFLALANKITERGRDNDRF